MNFKCLFGIITKNFQIANRIIIAIVIVFASLNAENSSKWNSNSTIKNYAQIISISDITNDNTTSPHDLSVLGNQENIQNEQCIYCHTQSNDTSNAVLWSNTRQSNSVKQNSNHPQLVSAASLKCLGCHDGATAENSLPNGTIGFSFASDDVSTNSNSRNESIFSYSTDKYQQLGSNHPIGIVYDESNHELNAIADLKIAKLEAGTNKVTCASCHEPHSPNNGSFLMVSNVGSSLCLDCHNK